MWFRERAAEHDEVPAEDEDKAPVDGAVSRDHAVAGDVLAIQAELRRPVRHERVQLDERPWVQQQVQALSRGQLAERVLPLDPDGSPADERLDPAPSGAPGRGAATPNSYAATRNQEARDRAVTHTMVNISAGVWITRTRGLATVR